MKTLTEIRSLDSEHPNFDRHLQALVDRNFGLHTDLEERVRGIIHEVRNRGDQAVLEYARRHDHSTAESVTDLHIAPEHLQTAVARLPADQREALELAATRIRGFHEEAARKFASWEYRDEFGNRLGQKVSPLTRVGFYIPGGQASYPSSILMSLIPAQMAGVKERIVISPAPSGRHDDLVLAAASLSGATRMYALGGAHGIAALACGTRSIPRVDKIVGPGGAHVTEAKRQVFGQTGIDIIAGPSEIVIISDGTGNATMLAADLLAQAEHDSLAQAILLSPDPKHLKAVRRSIETATASASRADIIRNSLARHGALILCRNLDEAATIANRIAPEHLHLAVADPETLAGRIEHAGAIFLGCNSAEVYGDYVAGPSHVLPTHGTARFSSPLGIHDFIKYSSIIHISAAGMKALTPPAVTLATSEGLGAHARSAALRLAPDSSDS